MVKWSLWWMGRESMGEKRFGCSLVPQAKKHISILYLNLVYIYNYISNYIYTYYRHVKWYEANITRRHFEIGVSRPGRWAILEDGRCRKLYINFDRLYIYTSFWLLLIYISMIYIYTYPQTIHYIYISIKYYNFHYLFGIHMNQCVFQFLLRIPRDFSEVRSRCRAWAPRSRGPRPRLRKVSEDWRWLWYVVMIGG